MAEVAPVYTKPITETRAERAAWAGSAEVAEADWLDLGGLRLRRFAMPGARSLFLHLHGGGWVFGGADQQDRFLLELGQASGATVLSLEYRLAPEHPFPAAVDDAERALRNLLDGGAAELGAGSLVIGGESAGANLAVVALMRLRQHPQFWRVRGASLHYGSYDLEGTPSLHAATPDTPFLDAALSAWFCSQYVAAERRAEPEVSPLRADLAGLPRALFLVGSADPVRDDSLLMAERWRAAGNACELAWLPGGLHGLLEQRTPLTVEGRRRVADFVRSACATPVEAR